MTLTLTWQIVVPTRSIQNVYIYIYIYFKYKSDCDVKWMNWQMGCFFSWWRYIREGLLPKVLYHLVKIIILPTGDHSISQSVRIIAQMSLHSTTELYHRTLPLQSTTELYHWTLPLCSSSALNYTTFSFTINFTFTITFT